MLRYVCVLKLEKIGPTFSSFHAIPAKMTKTTRQNNLMGSAL